MMGACGWSCRQKHTSELTGIAAQDDFLGSAEGGQSWKYCLRRYSLITDAIVLAKVT